MFQALQIAALFLLATATCAAQAEAENWWQPDAIGGYIGAGTKYKLKQALSFKYESSEETMYAMDLDWHLDEENVVNRAAGWIGATVEPVLLLAYRDDRQQNIDIYEAAAYANVKWSNFPWNHKLKTSISIGWGLSYTTDITANEAQDAVDADPDEGPQRWLNFLSFEYGFGLPRYPQWEVFYRLHHRSGAWGLFASKEVGSNVMGLGVRYIFE